jgi:hypothetical protein
MALGTILIAVMVPFCCGAVFSQSGWYWQNPLPQGNYLSGVSFIDANNGTAVGRGT